MKKSTLSAGLAILLFTTGCASKSNEVPARTTTKESTVEYSAISPPSGTIDKNRSESLSPEEAEVKSRFFSDSDPQHASRYTECRYEILLEDLSNSVASESCNSGLYVVNVSIAVASSQGAGNISIFELREANSGILAYVFDNDSDSLAIASSAKNGYASDFARLYRIDIAQKKIVSLPQFPLYKEVTHSRVTSMEYTGEGLVVHVSSGTDGRYDNITNYLLDNGLTWVVI